MDVTALFQSNKGYVRFERETDYKMMKIDKWSNKIKPLSSREPLF